MTEDNQLEISFGRSRTDTNWKPDYLEWSEFVERLRKVRRTTETMAEYDRMNNADKGKIKDGPAFVGGLIRGGRRKKENVESRWLITLDADDAGEDFAFMVDLILGGSSYLIYSTHSHRDNHPKYRLVVPTDREMLPDEYAAVSRRLASEIGMELFDKTTFDVHRLMYMPSCSKDATPIFEVSEGEPVSVDEVLERYTDWRDPMEWPRHPGEERELALKVGKLGDPTEKPGVIGAFCNVYSMTEGIEKFLAGEYEPTAADDRWTYTGGSSVGGMRVYDDWWAYSEHQSDPANDGHCHNIFDLIRIHKFGDLDEGVKDKTNATKYPSYQAMLEFAASDSEVKRAVFNEEFGDMEDEPGEAGSWRDKLKTHPKNPKIILPTGGNVELILENGPFKDTLAYDAFGNTEVIRRRLPWREKERPHTDYEPWLGADDKRMQHYFNKVFNIKSATVIQNAFTEVTHMNKFHPIKDFIQSVKWDGVKRLDTLFIDYLGCPDGPYEREATRKIMIAACKRLYEPGCKFDEMMVLVGPQGSHKSSLLARLGGPWFSDSIKNLDNKEAGEQLQKAWIVELGELSALKKSELEEVKAFLSKTEDRYRVAYDRVVSEFPRKCVFFGTTNTFDFLRDSTGGRRFWPIVVDPAARKLNHFEHLTDDVLHQLWAEALHGYRKGESVRLSAAADAIAKERQENHMEIDPRMGLIQEYLDTPITEDWVDKDEYDRRNYYDQPTGDVPRDRVSAIEIWTECLRERGRIPNWESRAIIGLLTRIPGWEPYPNNRGQAKVPGYGLQKVFVRSE
ncbi:virulence-associated E family protein [Paenibacillus polymyxa]|uniref:virulence-associated E family protein n=1 Tax=Paenibacillus polymyxa TaxID=1406 RepID=UPI000421F923|nr:virulence-associated E family protein [Paenibacillus polymyxa]